MGRAAALAAAEQRRRRTGSGRLRDALAERLKATIGDLVVNAEQSERAPHVLNVSVPGADSEAMLMHLDLAGVAASSGSACSTGVGRAVARARWPWACHASWRSAPFASASAGRARMRMSTASLEVMPDVVAKVRKLAGVLGRA